ncbi:MAG: hypothetical protein QM756_18400 [Polyangiaceae bacterium]
MATVARSAAPTLEPGAAKKKPRVLALGIGAGAVIGALFSAVLVSSLGRSEASQAQAPALPSAAAQVPAAAPPVVAPPPPAEAPSAVASAAPAKPKPNTSSAARASKSLAASAPRKPTPKRNHDFGF